MVPLPLLMNRLKSLLILLALALCESTLQAQTFATNILTTTYLDSWIINQTNNYGEADTIKVLVDGMGQADPTKDGTRSTRTVMRSPERASPRPGRSP